MEMSEVWSEMNPLYTHAQSHTDDTVHPEKPTQKELQNLIILGDCTLQAHPVYSVHFSWNPIKVHIDKPNI